MKLLFPAAAIGLLSVLVQQAPCQGEEKGPLRVDTPEGKAIFLDASTIEQIPVGKRKLGMASLSDSKLAGHSIEAANFLAYSEQYRKTANLIHLRGNVVIKMDCFLPLQGTLPLCTVLRADEAEYNEKTGEIKANGAVRVKLESGNPSSSDR